MSSLILVRHSIPEIAPDTPSVSWPLSNEGRRAAAALADRLNDYSPNCIVSSPETKAQETADILSTYFDCLVEVETGLREHERSQVGFMSPEAFTQRITHFLHSSSALVFGDETADAVFERFSRTIHHLVTRQPGADIMVVTHGTALSLYLGRLCQVNPVALWQSLQLPDAFVLPVEIVSSSCKTRSPACATRLDGVLQRIEWDEGKV